MFKTMLNDFAGKSDWFAQWKREIEKYTQSETRFIAELNVFMLISQHYNIKVTLKLIKIAKSFHSFLDLCLSA